jgi:hypothetical protein
MAQIAIPDDVLHILAACEAAYADASRKGYADNGDVIAAAADLRSAYRALVIANGKLRASNGLFDKTVATLRAHRACGAFRAACVKLQTTMEQASLEDRLYNRCVTLLKSMVAQDEEDRANILD